MVRRFGRASLVPTRIRAPSGSLRRRAPRAAEDVVLLALILAVTLSAQEPPATPIRWSAEQPTESVKAGGVLGVQVTAVIDEGWHLYALDPVEGGPIPTRIAAGPAPAFTLQEKDIEKPEPKR